MSKKDETVTRIRIGYLGERSKNRGLDQAIAMLQAKYPGAEIVAEEIKPGADWKLERRSKPLDAFHAQLGKVQR